MANTLTVKNIVPVQYLVLVSVVDIVIGLRVRFILRTDSVSYNY